MEPDEYECFITEWLFSKYSNIQHIGKTGDLGRDIIAWNDDGSCDIYQCKHYSVKFNPGEEILKLIDNLQKNAFLLPNCYYFVCLNGLSSKWRDAIINGVLEKTWLEWFHDKDTSFQNNHPNTLEYIKEKGFPIIKEYSIDNVINEHLSTVYGKIRFQSDETLKRLDVIDKSDKRYISELYKAYSENNGKQITPENISQFEKYSKDLNYQKECFFSAESLRITTEEYVLNTSEFKKLLTEKIYYIVQCFYQTK